MHSIKTPIITLLKDVSNIADMIATQNWSNSRRLYVVKALPRVQLKKKLTKKKTTTNKRYGQETNNKSQGEAETIFCYALRECDGALSGF